MKSLQFRRVVHARLFRKLCKVLRLRIKFDPKQPSTYPLDIVSCAIPRDLAILEHSIDSIREYLLHPLGQHYVIAPDLPEMREFCQRKDCLLVNEEELCPGGSAFYRERLHDQRKYLGGWLYQQFLKLSADRICQNGRFLTIDADTVLIRPVRYEYQNRWIFDFSDGYREDLDSLHRGLLPGFRLSCLSFMCHIMVMEQSVLSDMRQHLENSGGADWQQVILSRLDPLVPLPFSEFELYGNFALNRDRGKYTFSYWFNHDLPRVEVARLAGHKRFYQAAYKSLSFHHHRL